MKDPTSLKWLIAVCKVYLSGLLGWWWCCCSVKSNSLRPNGLQHARLPCPSPSPRACSNSCPSSQWCHLIFCHPLLLSIFPTIRVFSNESALHIKWPKYWSFSISSFNEYSGLISFRINWFHLLVVQGTLKSLLQHHSSKALILVLSLLYGMMWLIKSIISRRGRSRLLNLLERKNEHNSLESMMSFITNRYRDLVHVLEFCSCIR